MKRFIVSAILIIGFAIAAKAQVEQPLRYELEKKNDDDYVTVLPAGTDGVVILRDINKHEKGDIWEVTALDTTLTERWSEEVAVDSRYIFKGYEMYQRKLFLLFTQNEISDSDYYLLIVHLITGEIEKHDIKNEINFELSHLTVVDNYMVLGGYVRNSPTVVTSRIGDVHMKVVPGFFKDRSEIIDLRTNNNGTFNILTLEKGYQGYFLKLRTHAAEGDILFEKSVEMPENYRPQSGKTTDFVDGNIVVTGTYGSSASEYARGIYFAIVKPEGQKDVVKLYDFTNFEHFFDYMGERRAARIKRKIEKKAAKGKEFRYSSRLLIHEVRKNDEGYLLAAEVYNPEYMENRNASRYNMYSGYGFRDYYGINSARPDYVRRPNTASGKAEASHFEYLSSVVVKLNNQGELMWDNSIKVEDVETFSLEQIVAFNESEGNVKLLYNSDEDLKYKIVEQSETLSEGDDTIRLKYANDDIGYTYNGVGKSHYWYDDYFLVWGYHKVTNKSDADAGSKRSVLFINKVNIGEVQ